jgi:CheY-like chemotaxis protein
VRPQQDSNLRTRLRRPLLYPLSYGGWRPPADRRASKAGKGYQPLGPGCPPRGRGRPICPHGRGRPGNLARVAQGLGRVLVVDDDEVIRQLIAVNLTLEGFEVLTAVDGRDCLDKVTDASPDVITLDVMMPRLDGWVTATALRKNPETAGIKVVLISARAQEDDRARGREIGVDAYLTKPFDPAEMIRVVRELAGAPHTALD